MRNIQDMVNQEILLCVSVLVSDLTDLSIKSQGSDEDYLNYLDFWTPLVGEREAQDCAECAGWLGLYEDRYGVRYFEHPDEKTYACSTWTDLCKAFDLDPIKYAGEVYEHYAVTNWLADNLEAHCERVIRDWHGLNVWARTTTGQLIENDSVIECIYKLTHTNTAGG